MNISQQYFAGAVAVTLAVGLSYTSLQAEHHKTECAGKYTTRVQESRLFVDGGTRLRCDLFFSTPDGRVAVAKKDSLIAQQVPAFVWQYSGLLPVSDYLKTVAIHSVATDLKIERWQEVQNTFYNGLRAEGAADADAKIAFAGAYAFAPRWPLIELVQIPDEQSIADSKLYAVEVSGPAKKGLSVEEYRALSRDILDSPQNVTLQDIRGIVDSIDAGEGSYEESGLLFKLMKKIKGVTATERASDSGSTETAQSESMVVDIEPVRLEVAALSASDKDVAAKQNAQSDERAGEWVAMPDGSAVLREVAELAQKSSLKL